MNVGDYVRTKEGYITKIDSCTCWEAKKQWYISYTLPNGCECASAVNDRFKISPNIIDLIEVGDIIINKCGEIIVPNGGNIDELKDTWKIFKNIKSIVTKEQFESMEYKVGE